MHVYKVWWGEKRLIQNLYPQGLFFLMLRNIPQMRNKHNYFPPVIHHSSLEQTALVCIKSFGICLNNQLKYNRHYCKVRFI